MVHIAKDTCNDCGQEYHMTQGHDCPNPFPGKENPAPAMRSRGSELELLRSSQAQFEGALREIRSVCSQTSGEWARRVWILADSALACLPQVRGTAGASRPSSSADEPAPSSPKAPAKDA